MERDRPWKTQNRSGVRKTPRSYTKMYITVQNSTPPIPVIERTNSLHIPKHRSIPGRSNSYLLFTLSTPTVGCTQPYVQCAPGAVSLEIKRQGCLGDHSHPSYAEIKNKWSYSTVRPFALTTTVKYIFKNHSHNIVQITLREILATNTINESPFSPRVFHFPPTSILFI